MGIALMLLLAACAAPAASASCSTATSRGACTEIRLAESQCYNSEANYAAMRVSASLCRETEPLQSLYLIRRGVALAQPVSNVVSVPDRDVTPAQVSSSTETCPLYVCHNLHRL